MGNFSVNQVRQLYVVTAVQGTENKTDGVVSATAKAGTIALKTDKEGKNLYFQYKGADNLMRSDLINKDNILYAKAVSADEDTQKFTLKKAVVKLNSVNGGNPIGGQDYILRICINPYIGMSDEEPYFKYGAVHAMRGMTTGKFYEKLAASLYKNFSRELAPMLTFSINGKVVGRVKTDPDTGAETLIDTDGVAITVADEYADGVTITEVEQEWTLGIKELSHVNFTVIPTTVTFDGDEVTWGEVKYSKDTINTKGNGKRIADLEYFCMGERGDQYKNVGWPNVIHTEYLVDAEKSYDILEIHYAYVGPNEGPQRSEKDITIVCDSTLRALLNTLIGQFTTASGKKVEIHKDYASEDGTKLKTT